MSNLFAGLVPTDSNTYVTNNTSLNNAVTARSDGLCIPREESDPTLAPCIRINGKLVPNPESRMCRYAQQLVAPSGQCPTVCPDACVELWESCPNGTGVLTSLVHTKSPQHLIQLGGNTLSQFDNTQNYASYTECYAFGVNYCDFADSKLVTIDGTMNCYKDCPNGTTQDNTDPLECNAITTAVSCNPQYFETVAGGCKKKPLGLQQTTTCPEGSETFVNDQFTVEWCMPSCPAGFVHDLYYNGCLAVCPSTSRSLFQDMLDIHVRDNALRCSSSSSQSGKCSLQDQPGRCPTTVKTPLNAIYADSYEDHSTGRPAGMPIVQVLPKSWPLKARTSAEDISYQALRTAALADLNSGSYVGAGYPVDNVVCPDGMQIGLPNTGEETNRCYDVCPTNFSPAEVCRKTGEMTQGTPLTCENQGFVCVADCPNGWQPKDVNGIQTCEYIYPNNKVPTDPALFVKCPDNGAFTNMELTDSTAPNGAPMVPKPPVCIRKMIERNISCMVNFIDIQGVCWQGCAADQVPVLVPGGSTPFVCLEVCPTDGRFTNGLDALYNPGLQSDPICIRQNMTNGLGFDPMDVVNSADTTGPSKVAIGIGASFIGFLVLQRFFF